MKRGFDYLIALSHWTAMYMANPPTNLPRAWSGELSSPTTEYYLFQWDKKV